MVDCSAIGARAQWRPEGWRDAASGVRERDLRIVVALDAGLSQREVAAVEGVNQSVVASARGRLLKE